MYRDINALRFGDWIGSHLYTYFFERKMLSYCNIWFLVEPEMLLHSNINVNTKLTRIFQSVLYPACRHCS